MKILVKVVVVLAVLTTCIWVSCLVLYIRQQRANRHLEELAPIRQSVLIYRDLVVESIQKQAEFDRQKTDFEVRKSGWEAENRKAELDYQASSGTFGATRLLAWAQYRDTRDALIQEKQTVI